MESAGILSLDDNKLGKVTLQIDPTFNKTNWWTDMIKNKSTSTDELKVKLDVRMEKPQNLKMCGYVSIDKDKIDLCMYFSIVGAMLGVKMFGKLGNDDTMHLFR
jgi:hypothetical protein